MLLSVTDLKTEEILFALRKSAAGRVQILSAATGFVLAFASIIVTLQPAATQDLPFLLSLVHWALHIVFSILFVGSVGLMTAKHGMRPVWAVGMAILMLPFALAPFSLAIETSMGFAADIHRLRPDSYMDELRHVAMPAIGLTSVVAFVALHAVAFTRTQRAQPLVKEKPNLRRIFPDVDRDLGSDLVSLSADDHYVHLRTTRGTVMLNRKFSDCIDKLGAFDGQQVHRSHWVCHRHISQITRVGSSYQCSLTDGSTIPVSRRRYANLKRALHSGAHKSA